MVQQAVSVPKLTYNLFVEYLGICIYLLIFENAINIVCSLLCKKSSHRLHYHKNYRSHNYKNV